MISYIFYTLKKCFSQDLYKKIPRQDCAYLAGDYLALYKAFKSRALRRSNNLIKASQPSLIGDNSHIRKLVHKLIPQIYAIAPEVSPLVANLQKVAKKH